ncbi:hypothetical protein J1TS5_09760 [Paenibacillus macerans]|uniref:hypothetical protein n=1 Tax=Paenibacillus macerans TaxID=44252 RepID=UPI001B07A5CA|nr:hypothetical protein [Paenibacillus macerans]GIP08806.1 hypothetical protein J1TS5_09760 [Paenibacillus macerans]
MDDILIAIMRILAIHSLPYMLHGSNIHIGNHLLQIGDKDNSEGFRFTLNGSELDFEDVITWISQQTAETLRK